MSGEHPGSTLVAPEDLQLLVEFLRDAMAQGDTALVKELAQHLTQAAAEDLFKLLTADDLNSLVVILGDEDFADLLARIDDRDAADVLERVSVEQAADILEELDPDDAADIFSEVQPDVGKVILIEMEPSEADEIRELLAYPEDSAGGIMTPAFVAISPNLKADQAVAALRRVAEEAETINYVYVTDAEDHLLGVLSLHKLVLTRPDTPIRDLMYTRPVTVLVTADQEEAARILMEHDLIALPVVTDDGRILGIITVDDIADVIEREATEDIERLGGSEPLAEPYLRASPFLLFRKRVVWLIVLFLAQFITVSIMSNYESLLEQALVLSLFIPILIGTGGNIGSQTVSTIIRAIAVGEITTRDTLKVISKEMATGVMLGVVMALLMCFRAIITDGGTFDVAITVGATVFAIAAWAATVGAIIPILLNRLRVDPAVVSAPFITSLVDGTGLIIYFTFAQLIMGIT
jgi:magnesium transporter